MDDPLQPGAEPASGNRIRAGRHAARAADRRPRARRGLPAELAARRLRAGHVRRRGAVAGALPPSAGQDGRRLRPPVDRLPGRLRDHRYRHRHRPLRARLWRGRLPVVQGARHARLGDHQPGDGQRRVRVDVAAVRRAVHLGCQPEDRRGAEGIRQPVRRAQVCAQLHALLAPQDADHLSRHLAVVRGNGRAAQRRQRHAARGRARRHRRDRVLPVVGQAAPAQHDRQPPGLDAVAPAPMGRADGLLRAQGNRRAAPAHARTAGAGRPAHRKERHRGLADAGPARAARRRSRPVRKEPRHARRVVRLRHHALARHPRLARGRPVRHLGRAARRPPGRPVPGRLRPAPRLVPLVAADRVDAVRQAALQGTADARLHGGRRGPQDVQVDRQHDRATGNRQQDGRRDHPPVGGLDRLLGRARHLGRDPQARGGRLSPHPQYAALPAGQPDRLRPCQARPAARAVAGDRPLRRGPDGCAAERNPVALRRV